MTLILTPTQIREQLQIALDGMTEPYAALFDTYGSSVPPGSVGWTALNALNIAAVTITEEINRLNKIIGAESRT